MVIDAFPFNDELDMLELRLGTLDAVVDYFVLVESPRTFSGMPKPLYYAENKDRFAKWSPQDCKCSSGHAQLWSVGI